MSNVMKIRPADYEFLPTDSQTDRLDEATTLHIVNKSTVVTSYSFILVVIVRWDPQYRRLVYQVLMTTIVQRLWNERGEGKA